MNDNSKADRTARYEAAKNAKRPHISDKDMVKQFKHNCVKDGEDWVIRDRTREIRNKDRKACIRDWYVINGWAIDE